ncbi:ankyrin repeat and SOCS box protein 2-like [Alosa pseudoharengus]|uniref:ankyrin repeat and SOCS box protein 2-like n=1 Tax=Alosa pseudoharengus TaxID=34774 RepID=UPI003F8ADCB9
MAFSSVSWQIPTNLAFEDYSVYSHFSEEELIQLAVERSLTDAYGPSQPAHQSAYSPPTQTQLVPSQDVRIPTFHVVQSEFAARRPDAIHTLNVPPPALPPQTDNLSSDIAKLNSAILKNDAETVSKIVCRMPAESLCKPDTEGWIHLHKAAYEGSLECLKVLAKAFPKLINKGTHKNQTPLMLAVACKHLSCAQFLIAAGGDPTIAKTTGETALFKACEREDEKMVKLILKSGGSISRASEKGMTPLHEAVANRNVNICKLLVEAGAHIGAKNSYGIDPLFTAAMIGSTELLRFFISCGGDINTEANDGATALYEASKNGHEEVVRLLLSRGVDVNKTTKAGLTPLHVASKNGHVRVVLLLLPHTCTSVVRRSGISPLHLAAERNREAILEILIEAGCDVNTQLSVDYSMMYEDRRTTALYFTVRSSNVEAASMLLEAGADPNLDVFNPLLVAVRKGNMEMASLLMEHGANVNACLPTHPTTFPGVLLFCMKYRPMFKLILDNGCDASACFTCVYGNGPHPPVNIRHPTWDTLHMYRTEDPHTTTIQFCEVMADPSHSPWAGPIIDLLLDYVGHVKLCSRLIELLDSNKDWEYIKSRPPSALLHLCRVKIRQWVGRQRLRRMTSLPLPGRLIKYLIYDNRESEDFLHCGLD